MKDFPAAPSKRLLRIKSQTLLEDVGYTIFFFVCGNSGTTLIFWNLLHSLEISCCSNELMLNSGRGPSFIASFHMYV